MTEFEHFQINEVEQMREKVLMIVEYKTYHV